MPEDVTPKVGLAVIRCWSEGGGPSGFRAKVTIVDDLESSPSTSKDAATIEHVLAEVAEFLLRVAMDDVQGRADPA